jgi:hypothetical protein
MAVVQLLWQSLNRKEWRRGSTCATIFNGVTTYCGNLMPVPTPVAIPSEGRKEDLVGGCASAGGLNALIVAPASRRGKPTCQAP